MGQIFRWLGRRFVVYVILVLGLAFTLLLAPQLTRDARALWGAEGRIEAFVKKQQSELDEATKKAKSLPLELIDERMRVRQADLRRAEDRRSAAASGFLASLRPSQQLERIEAEIEIAAITRELKALEIALEAREQITPAREFFKNNRTRPTQEAVQKAHTLCENAKKAVNDFQIKPEVEQFGREIWSNEETKLNQSKQSYCKNYKDKRDLRATSLKYERSILGARQTLQGIDVTPLNQRDYESKLKWGSIERVLSDALWMLLVITVVPFAIRAFCYFVLAPLASRRPPVSFDSTGSIFPLSEPGSSSVSLSITLQAGEEALVRQDYLQSSSLAGSKSTVWLLDWRHALTSLASGMRFLTAISGDGERVTVSAIKDPLAELAIISIPADASVVARPSALAAVVQRSGEPVRIVGHWRLFSLTAWLTMQFRYFTFHGPARLVLKGGRGVRIEPAESGRIVSDDQIIGFSTDLSYSVIRTETFWPYFFGRESLLKDKVDAGHGILLIEEAPISARKGSKVGIEGLLDAMMKPLGI